jgi:threonine/homoserine/homoserine lactone efflux protein
MSPGPDFALVSRFAALNGRRIGLCASVGIAGGMGINTVAAIVGIGAVITASPRLFHAMSIVGAVYLSYLGVRSLLAMREKESGWAAKSARKGDFGAILPWTAFRQGLITNMLNPKSIVFLVALFPRFLTDHATLWDRTVLGAITVLVVLLWFSAMALAVGAFQNFFQKPASRRILNGVTGAVLVGLGVSLLLVNDLPRG